jgi:hypothetical protein
MPAIGAAIAAGWAAFTASAVGTFLTTTFLGRLVVSAGASLLLQHLTRPRIDTNPVGFPQGVTLRGGTNPLRFPLGRTMTAGQHVCPPMTHGKAGKTPNAYMTYVILLSNVARVSLDQVIINDQVHELGSTPHSLYGFPVLGEYAGYAWVKYYDGTQTVADPYLVVAYGSYPKRSWSAERIGRGLCYAIVTMRWSDKVWGAGHPRLQFVLGGIRLYDIRKDTTAGGSGSQRWSNPATWLPSDNPFVQAYNVMRGITLADGDVWGGRLAASNLDTASWAAAMNECDRLVQAPAGYPADTQFTSGMEVTVDRAPADYLRELLKGSSGEVVDMGGTWKARAGAAGLPIFFFTDDDAVVTRPQDFNPFPGLESSFNGVTATYPDPDVNWEPKDAPPRYNSTWEAQDGGRRKVAHLQFVAVSNRFQVQRLMKAYIAEERRFRRHGLTLPPRAAVIEPLDTVSWTSTANGYIDKRFQVGEVADDLATCLQRVALRERDPSDYDYPEDLFLPSEAGASGPVRPPAQGVPNWAVIFDAVKDALGTNRRPALRVSWDGSEQDDVTGVEWQVRLPSTGAIVAQGSTQSVEAGELQIAAGILPSTTYETRARFIAPRSTDWSEWAGATTGNVGIKDADFEAGSVFNLLRALNMTVPEIVSALPDTGNFAGRFVYLTTNRKFYRHTGTPATAAGFTVEVDGADILAGTVTAGAIAAGAVVASKIAVGDFTNLVPDSGLQDPAAWTNPAEFTLFQSHEFTTQNLSKGEIRYTGVLGGAGAGWKYSTSRPFGVTGDRQYRVTAAVARTLGTTVSVVAKIVWRNAQGSFISENLVFYDSGGITPFTFSVIMTAPAGAVTGEWTWGQDTTPGASDARARFFAPTVRVMNGGDLVVDGAIAANHLNTASLTTSGLAVFGGALQSDNYVANVSGWRINKSGSAQFQNLIVRGSLTEGAVSDVFQDFITTAQALTTTLVEKARVTLGVQGHGVIFKRAFSFEARAVAGGNTIVTLQARQRDFSGDTISAWFDVDVNTITDTAWVIYRDTGNLTGAFNEFEYRIVARVTVASTTTCLRNAYITVDRQTK